MTDEQKSLLERHMKEATAATERAAAFMADLEARTRAIVRELTALAKLEEGK